MNGEAVMAKETASTNWPLIFGLGLALLVLGIAVFGPGLAPRDPMEEKHVAQVGDVWLAAPYPPFKVPGFPLGSDQLGRDVLSQLLWAARPTLILVTIVAAVRMVLGIVIGLAAGWSSGGAGRALDSIISSALSAPTLIVALAVIAALGTGRGVWPFIVGLAATGWAETARLVREQTRSIKSQLYVEAAHALGGSSAHILRRHVLPQVMPLLWMLLSFEISGTLLTTAGLGFLGYYLGDVWVMVTDTAAQRHSGAPELGLMLSTVATDVYTGPWKMFAAGTMVFVTVLGFNLLGEGLRLRLDPERVRRRTVFSAMAEHFNIWLDEKLFPVLARNKVWVGAAALSLLVIGGLAWRQSQQNQVQSETPAVVLSVPGGHLWATERHDPEGTLGAAVTGFETPTVQWMFEEASGLSGGPAVAADGTVYVAAMGKTLYALDGDGHARWQVSLPAEPVGAPALSAEGRVYVADKEGGLSAFDSDGGMAWRFEPVEGGEATGSPIAGADGTIYYTIAGNVQAVSSGGEPLWRAQALTRRASRPPTLDPTNTFVFLRSGALNAKDGSLPDFETLPDAEQFLVGADGRTYLRFGNLVAEWRMSEAGPEALQPVEWDWRSYAWGNVTDMGVTGDRLIWLLYVSDFEDARLVLLGMDGAVQGFFRFPHRQSRIVATDGDSVAYACGYHRGSGAECLAFEAGGEQPVWQLPLDRGRAVNGGALAPGRLYVTTDAGVLYAIGE
jgi:peptide/nickel transport system permease protein